MVDGGCKYFVDASHKADFQPLPLRPNQTLECRLYGTVQASQLLLLMHQFQRQMARCLSGKSGYRLCHDPKHLFRCQNESYPQLRTLRQAVEMPRTLVLRMDGYGHRSYGYQTVLLLRTSHGQ
ncbi:hypothetical protein D9M71_643400 [compost metagenome]